MWDERDKAPPNPVGWLLLALAIPDGLSLRVDCVEPTAIEEAVPTILRVVFAGPEAATVEYNLTGRVAYAAFSAAGLVRVRALDLIDLAPGHGYPL
jgi:hypothetical protein